MKERCDLLLPLNLLSSYWSLQASFRQRIELLRFCFQSSYVITRLFYLHDIQAIVLPNLYINKVCRVNFQLNASACRPQNRSNETERNTLTHDQIQSSVSTLLMWASLIDTLPSIIFVLFLGPWSNEHGRKPLMIFPIIGYILSILIYMTVNYIDSLRAEYLLFANLPGGLLGGLNTFTMATNR